MSVIKDCCRGITLLKLTTDGHEALCGLSATTELVVLCHSFVVLVTVNVQSETRCRRRIGDGECAV